MWARFKNAFFEQVVIPVYNFWGWALDKLGIIKRIEKDPEKSWPYGHKVQGKLYYFKNREQLSLESRLSRRFRGQKDD